MRWRWPWEVRDDDVDYIVSHVERLRTEIMKMASQVQDLKDAVADLKTAQAAQGDTLADLATAQTNTVTELHRLADRIGSGTTDPAELAAIATDVKAAAEAMRGQTTVIAQVATNLQAVVDEPDPDAVPPPVEPPTA